MVGSSNVISREICRAQDADSAPIIEQRGTLLDQWPRPVGGVSPTDREQTWRYRSTLVDAARQKSELP
jgi:hypothetical protein